MVATGLSHHDDADLTAGQAIQTDTGLSYMAKSVHTYSVSALRLLAKGNNVHLTLAPTWGDDDKLRGIQEK